jgi:prepilin-type N-terminal cleavage/methylation domain-containing protein
MPILPIGRRKPQRSLQTNNIKGFTLLELLIVMLILLLSVAVVYPKLSSSENELQEVTQKAEVFLQKVIYKNLYQKTAFTLKIDLRKNMLEYISSSEKKKIFLPYLREVKSLTRGEAKSNAKLEFFATQRYGLEPLELIFEKNGVELRLIWNPFLRRLEINDKTNAG